MADALNNNFSYCGNNSYPLRVQDSINWHAFCNGQKSSIHYILDFIQQFSQQYKNVPKFSYLTFMNAHDDTVSKFISFFK